MLLAHEVGAGKTAEMVIGCDGAAPARDGAASRAWWSRTTCSNSSPASGCSSIPQARILATSCRRPGSHNKRRMLVARIATGDWDAVIVSRSAFERMPLSIAAQQRYLDTQLDDMRRQLDNAKDGRGLTDQAARGRAGPRRGTAQGPHRLG